MRQRIFSTISVSTTVEACVQDRHSHEPTACRLCLMPRAPTRSLPNTSPLSFFPIFGLQGHVVCNTMCVLRLYNHSMSVHCRRLITYAMIVAIISMSSQAHI